MNDESIYGSSENAIISSGELTEHELAMLDLNAAIRIGDDSIEVNDVAETEATHEPVEEDEEEQEKLIILVLLLKKKLMLQVQNIRKVVKVFKV